MKKQSTMGGFAYLSAAVLIVKILSLVYLPVLNAILGDYGFGVYAASYQVFVVIYAVANSGFPQAISKIVAELTAVGNYRDAVKAFKMSRTILVSIGFLLALIFWALSKSISIWVHYPRSYYAILALAPTVFLSTISSAYRGYFQGRGNMVPTAMSQVIEQVINIIFTLLLAYLFIGKGIEAGAAGGAFATSIAAFFTAIFLMHLYRKYKESKITKLHDPEVHRLTNKKLFRRILNYSIPLTGYALFYNLGNIVDLANVKIRLIYAGFSETEATKIFGYFTKYTQFMGVPNAIITSLAVALLPAIAAAAAREDTNDVIDKIKLAFKTCFMIAIPSAVGLGVLGDGIFRLMKYGNGSYIMSYGSFVLIFMTTVQVFSAILQGLGKLYVVSFFLIIGIAGKIIVNYILVANPNINILGAVVGNTVYYMIPLILGNIVLMKTIKTRINVFTSAVKPLIASGVMGVVIYFGFKVLNHAVGLIVPGYVSYALPVIICIIIGGYVYLLSLILIKGITREDFKILPRRVRRFIPKHMMRLLNREEQPAE